MLTDGNTWAWAISRHAMLESQQLLTTISSTLTVVASVASLPGNAFWVTSLLRLLCLQRQDVEEEEEAQKS